MSRFKSEHKVITQFELRVVAVNREEFFESEGKSGSHGEKLEENGGRLATASDVAAALIADPAFREVVFGLLEGHDSRFPDLSANRALMRQQQVPPGFGMVGRNHSPGIE
jgi:hypothetical protein